MFISSLNGLNRVSSLPIQKASCLMCSSWVFLFILILLKLVMCVLFPRQFNAYLNLFSPVLFLSSWLLCLPWILACSLGCSVFICGVGIHVLLCVSEHVERIDFLTDFPSLCMLVPIRRYRFVSMFFFRVISCYKLFPFDIRYVPFLPRLWPIFFFTFYVFFIRSHPCLA